MQNDKLRPKKYLTDALDAAENVQMDTLGMGAHLFFLNNIRWIAERGIEIIAEALKRSVAIEPGLAITELPKIFATRDKIVHEYDAVDPYLIHTIINRSIPKLIEELKDLLSGLEA